MAINKNGVSDTYTVSVVMATYHTGPVLLDSIKSVLMQKKLSELILVDNGNSNYMRGKLNDIKEKNDKLHIISGQGNIGFSRACNMGAHEAKGDYILLLNPDCILPANALAHGVRALQKNPKAWVAGCKLLNKDGSEQIGNRRNILTFQNFISEYSGLYKYLFLPRLELYETISPKGASYVPAISGAFMLMEKERYYEIGGMDKNYFLHIEDMDFCFQVNLMGGKIIFISDLDVVHHGSTSDVTSLFLNKCKADGLNRYFRKNYNGAYWPGALSLITAIIYIRFAYQAVCNSLANIKQKPEKQKDSDRYLPFLEEYKKYPVEKPDKNRDPKYYITNRSPILITDVRNDIGLCLLQRLLMSGVSVIALYDEKHIDLYHPKLTWIKGSLLHKEVLFGDEIRPKTIYCTDNIELLPKHIERFNQMGVKRVIAFNTMAIFDEEYNGNLKDKVTAEQEISRLCGRKKIDYTILRHPCVYGITDQSPIAKISKHIQYTGSFNADREIAKLYHPVHADDLAIAAIMILNLENTYSQSYNLTGKGGNITFDDIVKTISTALKDRTKQNRISMLDKTLYKMRNIKTSAKINRSMLQFQSLHNPMISSEEAEKDFGYRPRNFLKIKEKDMEI